MCFPERLLAFSPLHYGNGEKALASCLFSDSARTVWCSTEVKSVAAPSQRVSKVLFTRDGKMKREMDKRFSAAFAVLGASVARQISMFQSIYLTQVSTLTNSHQLQEVVQTTDQDASRIRLLTGALVMSHSAEDERPTKDLLEGLHIMSGLGIPW